MLCVKDASESIPTVSIESRSCKRKISALCFLRFPQRNTNAPPNHRPKGPTAGAFAGVLPGLHWLGGSLQCELHSQRGQRGTALKAEAVDPKNMFLELTRSTSCLESGLF